MNSCGNPVARGARFLSVVLVTSVASAVIGGDLDPKANNVRHTARGLFQAIDAGSIHARLIVRDNQRVRLVVKNKTNQPLTIRLPGAIAAIAVLAQNQNEVIKRFGEGKVAHAAARAACWHLQNKIGWEQLAKQERRRLIWAIRGAERRSQR